MDFARSALGVRPRLQVPAEVARDSEKTALQDLETLRCAKMVSFEIRARRDEIGAVFRKLMPGACGQGVASSGMR